MPVDLVVTIHQPDFLPWQGFFERWRNSGVYIVLDDVQFIRRGWHNRDKIKTKDGVRWFTVPVVQKGKYDQLIKDVLIDESTDWRSEHLRTLECNYRKAPGFQRCFNRLRAVYDRHHRLLIELNMDLLRFAAEELGITTPVVFASQKQVTTKSTQRLVDLVKSVQGTAYLVGQGSKEYLDESLFLQEHIRVVWQEFSPVKYEQLYGTFEPGLSVIDFLMNKAPVSAGAVDGNP